MYDPKLVPGALIDIDLTLPGMSLETTWDVGQGVWGGILSDPRGLYYPFTYESYDSAFITYYDHATCHMMEAIRSAATLCDELWMCEPA